ncbi:MAG: SGNH/GDSL hydrolase family protein [Ignavibacteriales bacterium]|nr:SGNH/GDSL hydrolase family protein [Ignavibacteriales bacterium]
MVVNLYIFNFDMKTNELRFIFFFLCFIIGLDIIIGNLFDNLYFSKKSSNNDRLIHSVLLSDEDILIFGSSRAQHHYQPQIFTDSLKMSCYNVGNGGQNIYYHAAILEATLERYTPKVAILDLMHIDFEQTPPQWDTEKLGVLLPFVNKSKVAYRAVLRRSKNEKIKLISNIYPFNSLIYNILRNNIKPFNKHFNGFIPLSGIWNEPLDKAKTTNATVDEKKIKAIYDFISLCKIKNIEIYIFVSPEYKHYTDEIKTWQEVIDEIQNKFNIPVFDYRSDKIFIENNEYFKDPMHLNAKGAKLYSEKVASKIMSIQNQKKHKEM